MFCVSWVFLGNSITSLIDQDFQKEFNRDFATKSFDFEAQGLHIAISTSEAKKE
jgi:hypothetical protein